MCHQSFVLLFCFLCSVNGLVFSEINSDCPNEQTSPLEECEFLELSEPDCNIFGVWEKTPSLYFILLESVDNEGNSPVSRLVLNLTNLRVEPGNPFYTICWKAGSNCNETFDSTMLAHRRRADVIPSYLLNGNAFPMVAILLKTDNHHTVWDLLVPEEDASHGKVVSRDGMEFIKDYLVYLLLHI